MILSMLAQAGLSGGVNVAYTTRQHLLTGDVKGDEMTSKNDVEFLKSVIDKLTLCVETNGGKSFISRSEFDKQSRSQGAPKEYSYDEYVMDSIGSK